jgi:hypothetical protein
MLHLYGEEIELNAAHCEPFLLSLTNFGDRKDIRDVVCVVAVAQSW